MTFRTVTGTKTQEKRKEKYLLRLYTVCLEKRDIYICKYCTCWTRILRQDFEQNKLASVTQNGTDVVHAFIYDWTEALQIRQVITRVTFF
jgi:hypothetical protein